MILTRSLPKSFLLILIALALLQSVARSANAPPPNPSDRDRAAHTQAGGARDQQSATTQPCPAVTVVVQQIPPKEAQRITAIIQEQPYKHWWEAPHAPEWALFILTIPYVIISGGLFYVSWKAADAAMVAAQAAALALGADRSFLEVEKPELKGTNLFVAHFHFKNRGKRPAVIDRLAFSFEPRESEPEQPDYRALIATATPQKQIAELVIGSAGESSTYYAHCFDAKPIQIASSYDRRGPLFKLLDEKKALTLFGFAEFHDTSGESHVSEFVWGYVPFGSGYWYCDYNHQT